MRGAGRMAWRGQPAWSAAAVGRRPTCRQRKRDRDDGWYVMSDGTSRAGGPGPQEGNRTVLGQDEDRNLEEDVEEHRRRQQPRGRSDEADLVSKKKKVGIFSSS
mmetsp:Transcript_19417/g.62334  ORF Transcript_19417/g.62334 Transcript_19417/m.62334 type:complete len:104 (+) Transcript_19417:1-312(+)